MKIKILFCLLFVFEFAISQSANTTELFELSNEDYSISFPSDWKLIEENTQGCEFYLFLNDENPSAKLGANINLLIQNLEGMNVDLDEFVELTEYQASLSGKLISSERIEKNSSEYHRFVFTANMKNYDLKFIQYDFVKNNKAYVLTFTARISDFEKQKVTMENVMLSFKLL